MSIPNLPKTIDIGAFTLRFTEEISHDFDPPSEDLFCEITDKYTGDSIKLDRFAISDLYHEERKIEFGEANVERYEKRLAELTKMGAFKYNN